MYIDREIQIYKDKGLSIGTHFMYTFPYQEALLSLPLWPYKQIHEFWS